MASSNILSFKDCKTVTAVQQKFDAWKQTASKEDLKKYYAINYRELLNTKSKLMVTSISTSINDTALKIRDEIGSTISTTSEQVRESVNGKYNYSLAIRQDYTAIVNGIKKGTITEQQKQEQITALNKKYNINIPVNATATQISKEIRSTQGGLISDINKQVQTIGEEFEKAGQVISNTYVLSEGARTKLIDIASKYEKGELTKEQVQTQIQEFNKEYKTNISQNATAKTLRSAANKRNGLVDVINNEINKTFNTTYYWDKSESKSIQKFKDAGISGDVVWDVIRGKYNKDDAARKDLEKLQILINKGQGNSEEAIALRNRINEQYELNLDDSVTAADITKIISSDQKYTYKKKIKEIAAGIIQDKINEQIIKQIEKRLGGRLEDWGLEFPNGDIVGTIRDIIRGNKVAFFNQEKFFNKLQKELETKIDKLIEEKITTMAKNLANQTTMVIDSAASKIMSGIDNVALNIKNTIDPFRQTVDNVYNKLDDWISNPINAKLDIAERLDSLIKSPTDKISSFLDRVEPFKKFGITLGLSGMFKTVTKTFTSGMADKIYKVTKPIVEKALNIVTTVKTQIKKLIDTVDKIKQKAKELVEQWKEKIKSIVQDFTKKIVDEISKFIKVGIGNLMGGFASGGLSLGGLF